VSLSEVLAHVDPSELVALTRDLVRIPSVVKPGDPTMTEAAVATFVQGWFEKEGFATEVHDAMVKATSQVTGRRARFGGVPGSTDGTILRTQLGIPIVTCGPGNRLIPHQVNEYVDIDELIAAARIYVASTLNFLEVK